MIYIRRSWRSFRTYLDLRALGPCGSPVVSVGSLHVHVSYISACYNGSGKLCPLFSFPLRPIYAHIAGSGRFFALSLTLVTLPRPTHSPVPELALDWTRRSAPPGWGDGTFDTKFPWTCKSRPAGEHKREGVIQNWRRRDVAGEINGVAHVRFRVALGDRPSISLPSSHEPEI